MARCKDLPLSAKDHEAHEWTGLGHFEEGQKVHAFVVGFLKQGLDPAVIALHAAHAVQVAEHACDHPGHSSDGFEEDVSVGIVVSWWRSFGLLFVPPGKHT